MATRTSGGPEGILLVDKAQGWTSHDVVARLRGVCGQRRMGHTGTLDPMATGLLVVCLGGATRLVEYMVAHDRAYEAEVVLGITTDTDDAAGTTTRTEQAPRLGGPRLRELEAAFTGALRQRPPAYSAIKLEGTRAYAIARSGGTPQLHEREVHVHALQLEEIERGRLRMAVSCGPGTYIRSIARDIGERLGCGAHLASLRRMRAGRFTAGEAGTVEVIEAAAAAGRLRALLIDTDEGVTEMDAAILGPGREVAVRHGQVLRPAAHAWKPSAAARLYSADGEFLGVGAVESDGGVRGLKVFAADIHTS